MGFSKPLPPVKSIWEPSCITIRDCTPVQQKKSVELRRRGFNVDIGVVQGNEKNEEGTFQKKQLEIDFVANLGNKRYYIQSAFAMPDSDKIKQEKKSLRQVKDNFRKIIIVKDPIKAKLDEDGILTISLFDFLLHDDSLDW